MYSFVMMTAIASTPDATQFNGFFRDLFSFRGGCGGCSGNYANSSSQCYGGCGGCSGWRPGDRIRAFFDSRGCCGGGGCCGGYDRGYTGYPAQGSPCSGYGSAYSCSGFSRAYSCWGGGLTDGFAPPSAAYFGPAPLAPNGCGGFLVPTGGMMMLPPTPGGATMDSGPFAPPVAVPPSVSEDPNSRNYRPLMAQPAGGSRATVVVRLPADAKLFAEGKQLSLTSAERRFVTPELPAGQEYAYTFRVEYERDGRTISEPKRVAVRPGSTVEVSFADIAVARGPADAPTTALASATPPAAAPSPAKIVVTVPDGSTLYVDGKPHEKTGPVREFTTPPLPPGKEYAYTMEVRSAAAGLVSVMTKVSVRAGATEQVDFVKLAAAQQRAAR